MYATHDYSIDLQVHFFLCFMGMDAIVTFECWTKFNSFLLLDFIINLEEGAEF